MTDDAKPEAKPESRAGYFQHYRKVRQLLGNPIRHKPDVRERAGNRHSVDYKPPARKKRTAAKPRPHVEKFRRLQFIGWDGEGIGHPRNKYVMLSNSKRECLRGENLESYEIFEFLLDHRATANTIHCVWRGLRFYALVFIVGR
jgi:hypothetical protein